MDLFADDPILPADPDGLEVLHDREHRVRAYRRSDDLLMIRGAVRDQKPPGLYIELDPDPLTIHHMQIELDVTFPALEIVRAEVEFLTYPNETCGGITEHYEKLVGLSIARGFTHRVRELFGGPRGCAHTTALLQAMAPVAVQCFWSMQASSARRTGAGTTDALTSTPSRASWQMNVDTCHVWASDGEHVAEVEAGGALSVPVFLRDRLDRLGIDPESSNSRIRGG